MDEPVKKRRRFFYICFGALGILSILMGVVVLSSQNEPEYEGKPASYWATRVPALSTDRGYAFSEKETVENAFRSMGESAIPTVIRNLRRYDSHWQQVYAKVFAKIPKILQRHLDPPLTVRGMDEIHLLRGSVAALELIEQGVDSWLLELITDTSVRARRAGAYLLLTFPEDMDRLYELLSIAVVDPDPWVRSIAVEATQRLKKKALPLLISAIDMGEGVVLGISGVTARPLAASILGTHGVGSIEAVTTLSKLLADEDYRTRISAEIGLLRIQGKPEMLTRLVQELEAALELIPGVDASVSIRVSDSEFTAKMIIEALGQYGGGAKDAVPIITLFHEEFKDRTRGRDRLNLKRFSADALKSIDPDFAASAGIE